MSSFGVVIERRVLLWHDAIERGIADILEVRVSLLNGAFTLDELQSWSMTTGSVRSIGADVFVFVLNEFEAPALMNLPEGSHLISRVEFLMWEAALKAASCKDALFASISASMSNRVA